MSREITFIRHGETVANATGTWQGHGDTPLSERGQTQVDELADRMRGRPADVVVTSDLGRAQATASAFTDRAEPDAAWREADIGAWEGLTREQIAEAHADELAALAEGEDVAMGGGETYASFSARVEGALQELLGRLDDGGGAVVVAHGGVIGSVVRGVLDVNRSRPRPVVRLANTSLTTVSFEDGGARQVVSFNDRSHLNGASMGRGDLWLIRHGQSEANVGDRWQGTTDSPLTAEGRRQATRLAEWGLPVEAVYSSPATRARSTAQPIAASRGVEPIVRPDVGEFHFGAWEDLTTEQIAATWPEEWESFVAANADVPRGGNGETWAGVAERMNGAVADLGSRHTDVPVALVSHGSAMRALIGSILGLDFSGHRRLALPENTSMSRVRNENGRMVLDSYNLTPHLEG